MRRYDPHSSLAEAVSLALVVHGALAAGLYWLGDRPRQEAARDEALIEVEVPPPPVVREPEPPPEPPPPVVAEPVPVAKPAPQQRAPRAQRAAPRAPEVLRMISEAPAPGTPTIGDVPIDEYVYRMPDSSEGSLDVAHGKPSGAAGGVRGGTGTKVGGGEADGTGSGPPRPVSVAAIKTPAKPKGDYEFIGGYKDYPEEARRLGIEGYVKVRLVVDESGAVQSARIVQGLGHGLDERALALARKLAFEPARDDADRAVTSVVVWSFYFTPKPS